MDIENELKKIIAQLCECKIDDIKLDHNLREDLNMDSLNFLEFEYEIQQLGIPELDDSALDQIRTVRDALNYAQKHLQA